MTPALRKALDDLKEAVEHQVKVNELPSPPATAGMLRAANKAVDDTSRAVVAAYNALKPSKDEFRRGVKASITWLHAEAARMADPHAKGILNTAAHGLGVAQLPVADPVTFGGMRLVLDSNVPDGAFVIVKPAERANVADLITQRHGPHGLQPGTAYRCTTCDRETLRDFCPKCGKPLA